MSYEPLYPEPKTEYADDDDDTTARRTTLCQHTLSRCTMMVIYSYIIISIILLTIGCVLQLGMISSHKTESSRREASIRGSGEIFDFKYGRNEEYMTLDHRYDHLWANWTSDALLRVPDQLSDHEFIPATFSMYHQLHCLRGLRTALQKAYEGGPVAFDWHEDHHWPHCLDYLRASILCWADDTIETMPIAKNGTRIPFIDGAEDVRKCRRPQRFHDLTKSY